MWKYSLKTSLMKDVQFTAVEVLAIPETRAHWAKLFFSR